LRKLLESIAAQRAVQHVGIMVFVADNDPDRHQALDVSNELALSFPWPLSCTIIEERGISSARNAILDEARRCGVDFIAMLDDDEVADPTWLSELLDCQHRFDADVVGGRVLFDFEVQPSTSVRNSGIFDVPPWKEGPAPLLYAAGNLLIKTQALSRARWPRFDLSFGLTGGEDGEFLRRMSKENVRFGWSPTAIVRESVPKTRSNGAWVLHRSWRKGNINMRIERFHGGRLGPVISLSKAIIWLVSAPITVLLLAVPSRRLWIAGKWSQSMGKIAALLGRNYPAYGISQAPGEAA